MDKISVEVKNNLESDIEMGKSIVTTAIDDLSAEKYEWGMFGLYGYNRDIIDGQLCVAVDSESGDFFTVDSKDRRDDGNILVRFIDGDCLATILENLNVEDFCVFSKELIDELFKKG